MCPSKQLPLDCEMLQVPGSTISIHRFPLSCDLQQCRVLALPTDKHPLLNLLSDKTNTYRCVAVRQGHWLCEDRLDGVKGVEVQEEGAAGAKHSILEVSCHVQGAFLLFYGRHIPPSVLCVLHAQPSCGIERINGRVRM
jgi:hypothetical protein